MQDKKIKSKKQGTNFNRQPSIVNSKGFTLVEVIIFIVVAGVIASTIFIPFMTSLKESIFPEKVATSTCLAQYKMEEFVAYDSSPVTPLTDYTSADISGYQWQWDISCVDGNLENSQYEKDTKYKLILVRIKDADNEVVELRTLVTRRPADE